MCVQRAIYRVQRGDYEVVAIPVLQDNFVYVVRRGANAVTIDAGAFTPLAAYLRAHALCLRAAFLTHGHADHAAGFAQLQQWVRPDVDQLPGPIERIELPGHTDNDVGFYFPAAGVVFTGDCLIHGACGRVLGGSVEALYQSLLRIKALPSETLVLGGHDYLLENLRFGIEQEPDNEAIRARLDLYHREPASALFVSLAEEIASNPFLRAPDLAAFAALRQAKDQF